MTPDADSRRYPTALWFALFFLVVFVLHIPLLRLPYFWDEAGYYVPAARDIFLNGSLIPYSTPSNAHPPLVLAYLALAWKLLGFATIVTRTAMLGIAAFALTGIFRLAERVANIEVAFAATICTTLYPVFFSQSSLAHLDLAAAGFTFWGLLAYVDHRPLPMAIWFSLGVLSKETAILAPLALLIFELVSHRLDSRKEKTPAVAGLVALAFPLAPLVLWYAYHWHRTSFIFGNPEFLRYNVQATLHPLRILLAFGLRLWQLLAYMGMYLLTLATVAALWMPPVVDEGIERRRIVLPVQFSFFAVIIAYVFALALIGGAVLARYMLPVVPLAIIIFVSTLRRRMRHWRAVVAIIALGFVVSLFVNPNYGFSFEDNLAYRDYVLLHQGAETFLEARDPMARVLTAWPANDEISRPYLGYVTRPMRTFRIEDFTIEQLSAAAQLSSQFDVALVFSTKYQPPDPWLARWRQWQEWKTEYFGYHRDLPPVSATRVLGGQLVYSQVSNGQWIGIIVVPR
ncbi:MAG TPA: glycosyltransferase family 39 protein [Terriglobales bacterium]|nr:glycosyltransferase family 39 protein [Terriglobales bacterium]